MLQLNLKTIPFSRHGSFFAVSYDRETGRLALRDVRRGTPGPQATVLFFIDFYRDGVPAGHTVTATPQMLTLADERGSVRVCFGDENTVNVQVRGAQLYLEAAKTRYDSLVPMGENEWLYHSYKKDAKYHMRLSGGEAALDAPWERVGNSHIKIVLTPDAGGALELEILSGRVVTGNRVFDSFDAAAERVKEHYESFTKNLPACAAEYETAAETARYILWSCVVQKYDRLTRPAVYMSMNHMLNIWSWDNCFNAMGVADTDPALALDQLLIFADHQDESGAYPDYINNASSAFGCVKPPVHVWTYRRLMERYPLFRERGVMAAMYDTLCKNINYWLEHRMAGEGTLPYYSHGNDSGWDNASVFHMGVPVESPDLAAHLIRSMDGLGEIADALGKPGEAASWKKRADDMYALLMQRLYVDGRFIARHRGEIVPHEDSLLLRMPLLIAYRLPADIVEKLADDVEKRFLCPAGVATEALDSPLYLPDGYWLGPVWAPSTFLLWDALISCGRTELAREIALRFLHAGTIGGMAENFDAQTCVARRDPAFTWTSSVYLMLARYYNGEA